MTVEPEPVYPRVQIVLSEEESAIVYHGIPGTLCVCETCGLEPDGDPIVSWSSGISFCADCAVSASGSNPELTPEQIADEQGLIDWALAWVHTAPRNVQHHVSP